MKEELLKIIAEYLDTSPDELQDTKTLIDLQIDSLDFVEIMFEIEEKFDVSIMFEMQEHKNELGNLGDVLRLLEREILKNRTVQPASGE
jgi:acyl carrier protein